VNFGGYHAEAGLGGLLRGTGGGLHASAGTPWGAHAGAGLGGQLGDNLGEFLRKECIYWPKFCQTKIKLKSKTLTK